MGSTTSSRQRNSGLADARAAEDDELLQQAKALLDAVKAHRADTFAAIGVVLEDVEAAYLKIGTVQAAGTGVQVRGARFTGGIAIGSIGAGVEDHPLPPR